MKVVTTSSPVLVVKRILIYLAHYSMYIDFHSHARLFANTNTPQIHCPEYWARFYPTV